MVRKIFFITKPEFFIFLLVFLSAFILTSCASSNVSREAASNVDRGVQNAKNLVNVNGNIADTYQNSSQASKGAVIGGAAGAVTGLLTSSIGLVPGLPIGAILGASYGSYLDSQMTLQDKLENRGANIIVLGDQILIVIPSARLFDYLSPDLKPQSYSTLQLVAEYINQYTKILVKVAGYTDNTGSERIDLALSQQQAQRVAKVLLASGIDARILYAEGYGSSHLVERNTQEWDTDNYRIEITLEKLYV